ncbi:glycosyltransferase family 39 protein [Thermococcus thioreducens]|uniref:dolichyl-phosphooligosaccharide-protein glycotransferase n=1 Tax=Thermococcus thioreducens TaxID=277988 RepID=A0A0Q2QPL2_9EURY|nr:glycosyltransferase family 39 protein [Thermococcus thioreducens]ASJ11590.1 oligosaccharyl transferase, STT3 subunit [Thermococcus thioreducens]KQH81805.1 oligosaccharyl transferase, STT3 subunit [Thermococcus thioreducens]SEW03875.1 dolichyl-diphosphooligosaccharide--protein glycosyltransferase [Thermococcus thioreducens]
MDADEIRKRLAVVCGLILTPKYAAVILTVLASAIRLLPMRFKYLLGYDPYFHLAYIRYALEKGEWVNFFPYAIGPWGFQIHNFHPLGLWMTPAYVNKFLSVFGVSLYDAFRITPVIFGVLTVLFTYLAILRLYGKKEAFLSAFFLAVLFGHVFRSMAGYYRGDNYMLFWYSVALSGIALALTWKPRKWRYGRLAFYLIPALAGGFSAIFWQAYYPIFAFLLANAVLLSVGAFLLEREGYLIDSLILAASTALGAVIANSLGGIFGYGMVGYNRWLGKKLAEELGLNFGWIKDAFLLAYLKYAIPLAVLTILLLLVISRFLRGKKTRILVVGIGFVVFLWLAVTYYGRVSELLLRLFPEAPIVETQRTAFKDWWEAYGLGGVILPLFALRFSPSRVKLGDFLLLGTLLVQVPMVILWTRFLFIGSISIALSAGIGLIALYEVLHSRFSPKKSSALALSGLLILIPLVGAYQGFQATLGVEPLTNEYWEKALSHLKENSNMNDVVLSWWDQGHWVTYFAGRAPVAQGGPNRAVAQYYLGLKNERYLMNLGVDYIIVSYDIIMKFGSVLNTAGASPSEYAMIPLPLVSSAGGMLLFSSRGYSIMAVPKGDRWSVQVNVGSAIVIPQEVFVEREKSLKSVALTGRPNADAYVYINLNYGYAVLMNGKAFNTPLARLMFTDEYPEEYEPFYSDGGYIKIFRFEHPNVVVTAENGSVVLRFTNATGTGIGIYGYLDNGTLVFKKWYGVKGKDKFTLPGNLNGSVVVRYTYVQKKTVLDRGVFRIDDVLHGTEGG